MEKKGKEGQNKPMNRGRKKKRRKIEIPWLYLQEGEMSLMFFQENQGGSGKAINALAAVGKEKGKKGFIREVSPKQKFSPSHVRGKRRVKGAQASKGERKTAKSWFDI